MDTHPAPLDDKIMKLSRNIVRHYSTAPDIMAVDDVSDRFSKIIAGLQKVKSQEGSFESHTGIYISSSPGSVSSYLDAQFSKEKMPVLLFLYYSEDKEKRRTFPFIEAHGYRMVYECGAYVFFARSIDDTIVLRSGLTTGDTDLQDMLGRGYRSIRHLQPDTAAEMIRVPARDLLVPRRFDIALKALYGRLYLSGAAKEWREEVYYEQGLRITGPSPNLKEYDGSGKEGMDGFTQAFHSLLNETEAQKFPPFVIDRSNVALDGAHRIAAGIIKNSPVDCIRVDYESPMQVGTDFFAGISHGHSPCPAHILDAGAIEYCQYKDTTAIALIFPSVPDAVPAIDALSDIADIVYRKDIVISPKAGGALLMQAYLGQPWLTLKGIETGFEHKQKSCFPFSGTIRVLLLDSFDPSDIRPVKEKIRAIYGIGNHSIHITDSAEETLRIARAVFNDQSVGNLQRTGMHFSRFNELFSSLRDWMLLNDIDENNLCIDSSAVLSVLGLRECKDLDFLYLGDAAGLPPTPSGIECHNNQAIYYGHAIEDIIGDPRLHFWYMGVKFCTPAVILEMKEKRGESKDLVDASLLKSALPAAYLQTLYKIRISVVRMSGTSRARLSLLLAKIKNKIRPLKRLLFPKRN